jgi:recombination protein RecT
MTLPDTQQKPAHPMVQFKRDLEAVVMRDLELLDDKSKQRMKNAAMVAVSKDGDLVLADRQSFFSALRQCANHGVIPDGIEAVLQVYNTKVKLPNGKEEWIKKVTYLPMVRGIINRVQKSGKIRLFYAETVYDGETFKIDTTQGDRRPLHEYDPMRRGDEKSIIGAYSVALYADGTTDCEPMPRDQIEKVRNVAKTKNVWDGWFAEKAKVAVMKRHAKRLPLSSEDLEFILNRDETDFEQPVRDITPDQDAPKRNLAQRLAEGSPQEAAEAPEAITGEIMPDEADTPVSAPESGAAGHWTDNPSGNGFPGSQEWEQGVAAYQGKVPVSRCPYKQGTQEAADWVDAWHGARAAEQ